MEAVKAKEKYVVALVTVPDRKTGRKLAKVILEGRAAACVNIVSSLESWYWWQGRVEQGKELLLLIKTTADRLATLEETVLKNHPYDTPEFVVLQIDSGNEKYLRWICDSVVE